MTRRDIERIEISFLSLWSLQRVIQGNYRVIQGQCHSQAKRKSETKKENAGRRNGAWSHFLAAADLSFKHASIAWERQMRRSWVVREANFVRQGKLCFVGGPWFNATKDKFVLLSCVAWTHLCPRTVSEKNPSENIIISTFSHIRILLPWIVWISNCRTVSLYFSRLTFHG